MAEYALYMGGQAGNSNNAIVPQNTPCDVTGYADHQRRRSYAVNRQIDFRARVPYGGLDGPVDQKDYCWYQTLLNSDADIEVGDFINLVIVVPFTRLEFVEAQVVIPREGLVMTVCRRTNACTAPGGSPAAATVALTAASNSQLAVNALGETEGIFWSTRVDSSLLIHSFISLEVTAIPGDGDPVLEGLFMMVQAEVVDWGSYDFNGNA